MVNTGVAAFGHEANVYVHKDIPTLFTIACECGEEFQVVPPADSSDDERMELFSQMYTKHVELAQSMN